MSAIIALGDVKGKLTIPTSDTSEDTAIQLAIDGVIAFITEKTGYEGTATAHTIYRESCQVGRTYEMDHRPIDTAIAVTAQGRTHSGYSTITWSDLVADIIDADKGRLMLLGVSNFFQSFPPIEPPNPIFRWQQPIWPLVKFTYTTVAQTASTWPKDLKDAAAHLAAFMYRQSLTSHLNSASLGPISETYSGRGGGDPVPGVLRGIIDRYALRRVLWTP